jgi:PAS domain S-box-containing protein
MPLKELLESADIFTEPVLVVRTDGVIEYANRAFAAQFGLDADAVAGKRLDSLTAGWSAANEDFLRSCARSARALYGSLLFRQRAQVVAFQTRGVAYPPKSAPNACQVLLSLQPMPPTTAQAASTHLDAPMEHAQEIIDSLRRQSQILEVTLASIGDAVIVTDEHGRIVFINSVGESLTGWPAREAKNQPLAEVFQIVNERTRRVVEDPVQKVLQTGVIIGLANHTVLLSRSGREIAIDDSAAPIRMADGTLFGVVLIFRDISEQRRAEHSRAWLAAIVESTDDPIVSKTLEGVVTSWNPAAERLFGYRPEEIIGKPITTIVPTELYSEELDILARLRRGERIEHLETVRQAKGGKRIDVSLTVSPIRNEHGEIVGASKIARDIRRRKEWDHQQREAARLKDEFLATLGHELRNPLAPIQNATEIILRRLQEQPEHGPPTLRTAGEILRRQLSHLTRLVDDLLDVSRITSGRLQLRQEVVEIAPLLMNSVDSVRHAFEAQRQSVTLSMEPGTHYVRGDRVRLTQVFSNLLQNANKYTAAGGHIEVGLHYQDGTAVISVRDNGVGISRENLQAIFELFFQSRRSFDGGGGGLGIGLSLARRLVQMHGGSIDVRSEGEGRGSEFSVRLPLCAAPSAASPTAPAPDSQAASRRVLVADDNEDAALSLALLLQSLGHETRTAHDGAEAIELAEQFHPEVVFVDLAMPKLDGYEVARRLRTRPWAQRTLLVALTGWGQQTDRERTKQAGFAHHVVKPIELETLRQLLAARG